MDAAEHGVLSHKYIAGVIKSHTVRGGEKAGAPFGRGQSVGGGFAGSGVVAEAGDDFAGFVV